MGERTFESRFETVGAARRGCPAMNAARKHLGRRIDKVRRLFSPALGGFIFYIAKKSLGNIFYLHFRRPKCKRLL
jgi:hypothetical protein